MTTTKEHTCTPTPSSSTSPTSSASPRSPRAFAPAASDFAGRRCFGLAYSIQGHPIPEPEPHPLYDRIDQAVIDALRIKPHSRRMLRPVVTAAGVKCTAGEDRQIVFTLERLAAKGYRIWAFGPHARFEILAEPIPR